jgi:hypothetical protein
VPASFGTGAPRLRESVLTALRTTCLDVALAVGDATSKQLMRSGVCGSPSHMGSASYTSTVPPDSRTGHPLAFDAASARDSAVMIE